MAGTAILKVGRQASAASPGNIQVAIDGAKVGEPINPMIFGGYMEPATTRVWSEMLSDRKFVNAIQAATAAAPGGRRGPAGPGGGMFRRFGSDPFRPVGPADAVVMDTVKPFVGKHSPRIKRAGSEPRGIQASGLRVARGKSYTGRIWLAGDPGAKVLIRLVWGEGASGSQTITAPPLNGVYQKVPLSFSVRSIRRARAWRLWVPAATGFMSGPLP